MPSAGASFPAKEALCLFGRRRARPGSGWLLILALAAAAGTGCNHQPRADFVACNGAEIESLDPHILTGQPDGRVASALFEGLLRLDPKTGEPIPGLAERWTLSTDQTVYTFHLRSNVMWSTGEPITAGDVVFSWRRALDPATAADYAGQLYYIRNGEGFNRGWTNPATGRVFSAADVGVTAPDPQTVRCELVGPTPFFLNLCAFRTLCVVPAGFIARHGDHWTRQRSFPCSGAYTLEFWRLNDRVRVRRNPRYWDDAQTGIDVADFISTDSSSLALNLLDTGHADAIWDKGLVPAELMDVLRDKPYTLLFDYLATYFYRYNVTRPPFDDPRVRRALLMAIDKDRIVTRITRSGEQVARVLVPPYVKGYTPPAGLPHDPAGARKLLAEAGFPGGQGFPVFDYLFNTSELNKQIAVELQDMWRRELGLRMDLRQMEWKVFLNEQSQLRYTLCRGSWVGDYADPNTFLDLFMSNNGNNRTGWKNPRYDTLMRQATVELDPARRARLMLEAEKILVEDECPIGNLYFYKGAIFFHRDRWDGIHGNMIDEHPLNFIRRRPAGP